MSKKPNEQGLASALVKIHQRTLDFIDGMCKRWEGGDRLAVIIQACIQLEVICFTLSVCVLLVLLLRPEVKELMYVTFTPMFPLFGVILVATGCRAHDDKPLATGQTMRVHRINPKSIYRAV